MCIIQTREERALALVTNNTSDRSILYLIQPNLHNDFTHPFVL